MPLPTAARRGALALTSLLALGTTLSAPDTLASSHREAPFISRHPKVDGTDFYMFRSYEPGRQGFVTLIANYLPLQDSYGGPNYFMMDPDALYEIHVDNDGDNREDITFQFRFQQTVRDIQVPVGGKSVSIPLQNAGAITAVNPAVLNTRETYSINVVRSGARGGRRGVVTNASGGGAVFDKPIDNIGNKSIPDYAAYAALHRYDVNIPGCGVAGRVFVGQRKEGFGVNLGEIFDLINIPTQRIVGSRTGSANATADKNVTSIALEVPIQCLTNGSDPVIGAWTTASLRQGRLLDATPPRALTGNDTSIEGGPWVQVSRLGMPLVNEVVIGLPDKDRFNASQPRADGQFADYVTNPTLPALIELLYGAQTVKAPTRFPRADLVAAFLTGVPNVNQPAGGRALSEMLRLNTALPATARGSQNSLGALQCFTQGALALGNPGCDPAGFPNGRRPGDDVVDIALRVVMGVLLPLADAPSGQLPYTDGVLVQSTDFDNAFPYLTTPLPGSPNGANGLPANQ